MIWDHHTVERPESKMLAHTAQYGCTQHNMGAHSTMWVRNAQWLFWRLAPPSHCFLHWGAFGSNGEHCGEHANTKSNQTLIWCHTSSHHHHCCHPLAPISSSSFHLLTYHPVTSHQALTKSRTSNTNNTSYTSYTSETSNLN